MTRTIRSRLGFLAAAWLVPVLGIALYASSSTYRSRLAAEERAGVEVALTAAASFQAYSEGVLEESAVLGDAFAAGLPPAQVERMLLDAARRRPSMRSFSWVSPEGQVLTSSHPEVVGLDLSDRDYVLEVQAGRDNALGDLAPAKLDGRPVFAFARAVRGPGRRLEGIVVSVIDPERLDVRALRIARLGDAAVALVDRNGAVVFRTPRLRPGVSARADGELAARALAGFEATGTEHPAGGAAQVGAAVPIAPFGWAAHATRARAEVLGPIRRDVLLVLGLGLSVALGGIAASAWLAAWIHRGLLALAAHAAALGRGERPPPATGGAGPREIEQLGRAFDDMAARLVSQRTFFEGLFRAAPTGIAVLDADELRFRWVNPAYQGFVDDATEGRSVVGVTFAEAVPAAEEHGLLARLRAVAETGQPVEHRELEYRPAPGRTTYWRWRAQRLDREDGRHDVLLLVTEVTDEVIARRRTEHERRRLETVLKTLPVGVFIADARGRIVDVNEHALRVFGAAAPGPDRIDALPALKGVRPGTGEPLRARDWPLARAVLHGETCFGEHVEIRRADGTRGTIVSKAAPIRDASGAVTGAIAVVQDVTAQRQMEEALRASEERFRRAIVAAPFPVMIHSEDGAVMELSRSWTELTGWTLADAPTIEAWTEKAYGPRAAEIRASIAGQFGLDGPRAEGEHAVRTRDGTVRLWEFAASPLGEVGGKRLVATMAVDVTDRRRAEDAVREADRRKSELHAVLSHELRNPLAPIRNSVALLQRLPPGDPRTTRAQTIIERQVGHVTRLVDDLLDVSRISRGLVELQRARVDLVEVVRRTAEDHRALLGARSIALELELPARPVYVDGDHVRLAQVLANLLHNAGKFTPAGGTVTVALDAGGPGAVLTVRDTGVGMSRELLDAIFEPFTQADQGLARSAGGLGLGLALVKGLVELHGGSVEAHSDGPGRGAEFAVHLPVASAPAALVRPRVAAAPGAGRRVLVIEDNVDGAESLKEVLELDGHEVVVAHDGDAGLARARSFAPEVVLCDLGLPGIDGYEVARRLRADASTADVRLVALTGYALSEDRERARAAGFDHHVAKPPSMDELRDAVAGAGEAA
jgi:PAS domain S-box-containing protein